MEPGSGAERPIKVPSKLIRQSEAENVKTIVSPHGHVYFQPIGGKESFDTSSFSRVDFMTRKPDLPVAIKTVKAGGPINEAQLAAEARLLGQLEHPHIARVLDIFPTEEGFAMVTKRANGGDLEDVMFDLNDSQKITILGEVSDAIDFANRKGILHKDIKPANILITTDSDDPRERPPTEYHALVADFGVANVVYQPKKDGFVSGTSFYMPYEQQYDMQEPGDTEVSGVALLAYTLFFDNEMCNAANPKIKLLKKKEDRVLAQMQIIASNDGLPEDAAKYIIMKGYSEETAHVFDKALRHRNVHTKAELYNNATEFANDLRASLENSGKIQPN